MGAGVAGEQALERRVHVGEERLRQPARRHSAEGVAVQARVVSGDPTLLARQAQADRPPLALELGEHRGGVEAG